MSRVLIDLNGHRFKLASDPEEVARSVNAFPIPRHGELTIDISEYMLPGFDANVIEFITQGPADTDWRFVIAPEYVEGQMGVAYAIEGLVPFPEQSALLQNFPNPFRESTTFTITVAEDRLTGMHLRLEVFDIRGRRVRSLLDDMRFPGAYEVEWDGRDDGGTPVASGIYLVRLLSERYQHVVRITRLH